MTGLPGSARSRPAETGRKGEFAGDLRPWGGRRPTPVRGYQGGRHCRCARHHRERRCAIASPTIEICTRRFAFFHDFSFRIWNINYETHGTQCHGAFLVGDCEPGAGCLDCLVSVRQ